MGGSKRGLWSWTREEKVEKPRCIWFTESFNWMSSHHWCLVAAYKSASLSLSLSSSYSPSPSLSFSSSILFFKTLFILLSPLFLYLALFFTFLPHLDERIKVYLVVAQRLAYESVSLQLFCFKKRKHLHSIPKNLLNIQISYSLNLWHPSFLIFSFF